MALDFGPSPRTALAAITPALALLLGQLLLTAPAHAQAETRPPGMPAAHSLTGEPLHPLEHPDPAALARADEALSASPGDPARLIQAGQERDRAFRYDEAIGLYTRAIQAAPQHWRGHRFRGHRYLSVRRFDDGARDLERARDLAPFNFDVAYHLGLAYYLQGRFDAAADEYLRCIRLADDPTAPTTDAAEVAGQRTCMSIAERDDTRVAIAEWAYRALRRAGREEEARALLATVRPGMDVSANVSYYHTLLARRGEWDREGLLAAEDPAGRFETRAYGLAVDALLDGDRDTALTLLRRIANDPHWPGFGRVAAEADLQRLGAAPR